MKKGKAQELVQIGPGATDTGLLGFDFVAGWKSRSLTDTEVLQRQPQGIRAFLTL